MANATISTITLPNGDVLTLKDINALKNIGALGDLVYWSATNTPAHLGIGADGKILKSNGEIPEWVDEYKVELVDMMEAT